MFDKFEQARAGIHTVYAEDNGLLARGKEVSIGNGLLGPRACKRATGPKCVLQQSFGKPDLFCSTVVAPASTHWVVLQPAGQPLQLQEAVNSNPLWPFLLSAGCEDPLWREEGEGEGPAQGRAGGGKGVCCCCC